MLSCCRLLYAALDADKESNWFLPIVNVVLRQLRVCSYAADGALERVGEKTKHMIETQDVLRRYLNRMVVDRAPLAQSKKMGCLFVIVHLFKLYFKLNNLKLCTFLIRMVPQLPPLEQFTKAQVIAYKYYLGRLHVFEEKYDEAEQCLAYAFAHCSRASPGNKKRILQFLIPVRLLKAQYPLDRLLAKYDLLEFQKLIVAIKRGDLESFNGNLQANQRFFIQKGIYLILEKLKIFVYRNLFRKVYVAHTEQGGGRHASGRWEWRLPLGGIRGSHALLCVPRVLSRMLPFPLWFCSFPSLRLRLSPSSVTNSTRAPSIRTRISCRWRRCWPRSASTAPTCRSTSSSAFWRT